MVLSEETSCLELNPTPRNLNLAWFQQRIGCMHLELMGHLQVLKELYEPEVFGRKCAELQRAASSPLFGMDV